MYKNTEDAKISIATNLKQLRREAGLTQQELADKINSRLNTEIKNNTISSWESAINSIDNSYIPVIADILNTTINSIYGITTYDNILPITKRTIPLLGEIAAGEPIFADEEIELYVEVTTDIQADYCLKVKGDSMINARINDGDIVFIRKQDDVNNGEIAAVIIDDKATLKRVYKTENEIMLVAENPACPPRTIRAEDGKEVRILGKAVAFQSDVR